MQLVVNVFATALLAASVSSHRQSFNPINFGGGRYDPVNLPVYGNGAFPHRRQPGIHPIRPAYGQFGGHFSRPLHGQYGSQHPVLSQGHVGFGHQGATGQFAGAHSGSGNRLPQGHLGQAGILLGGEPINTQGFVGPAPSVERYPAEGPSLGSVSQTAQGKPVHAQGGNVHPGLPEGTHSVVPGIVDVPQGSVSGAVPNPVPTSQQSDGQLVKPLPGQGGLEQVAGGIPSVNGQPEKVPVNVNPSLTETAVNPDCRLFKKDQNGRYICDNVQVSEPSKPFECPAVTPFCPKLGERITPQQCESDADCLGFGKCCSDACYQYSICKGQ
ncbi:uncharacterized protein [Palaemon carinicauda]|uniref:uncharacterized protein n=1 Tax=Palaemon carinicauda TaxID=392227 RepID=UPI0035B65EBF